MFSIENSMEEKGRVIRWIYLILRVLLDFSYGCSCGVVGTLGREETKAKAMGQ